MLGVQALVPTAEAPNFGSGSVPAKTFSRNNPIAELQVPAASGGNGVITCIASGLPAGLVFDADGSGSWEIYDTPTTATSGAQTRSPSPPRTRTRTGPRATEAR